MELRKSLLKSSRLYLILDRETAGKKQLLRIAKKSSLGGADIIQLRDKISGRALFLKEAKALSRSLKKTRTLFIVNDSVDAAKASDADGVHLGQADMPIKKARRALGRGKLIGISCHSLKQALEAQKSGADYIGIGPVYATATKPSYRPIGLRELKKLKGRIRIPYFAIGGIDAGKINEALSCLAERIAVCRAIIKAKDPRVSSGILRRLLN